MLSELEHFHLVFTASRLGIEARDCCGEYRLNDQILSNRICQRCRAGHVSQILGVHDHGQCEITHENKNYICMIEQYRRKIAQEGGFRQYYTNTLIPFERDYTTYVLARRSHNLLLCSNFFINVVNRNCELCREGVQANLEPEIHENGNCFGEFDEDKYKKEKYPPEEELRKKCWLKRAYWWFHDAYRLSDPFERT